MMIIWLYFEHCEHFAFGVAQKTILPMSEWGRYCVEWVANVLVVVLMLVVLVVLVVQDSVVSGNLHM